jgi:hypothetical protein
MKKIIISGLSGFSIGILMMLLYINNSNLKNLVAISGKITFDSNFYKNHYFINKEYIEYPVLLNERVYLKIDNKSLLSKKKPQDEILVTGYLKVIDIGEGEITEMDVVNIK